MDSRAWATGPDTGILPKCPASDRMGDCSTPLVEGVEAEVLARLRRLRLFRVGPMDAAPLRGGVVDGETPGREGGFSRVSMTAEFCGAGGGTGVEGIGVPLRNRAVSLRLTGPRMGRASDKVD